MEKKLYRINENKMLCGVCTGLAKYFNLDLNIVRIIMVIFGLFGAGVLAYILCAFLVPEQPAE